MAGEAYHLLYHRIHGISAVSLRLTNTYGPRMRIKDGRQTFLGLWVRRLLEDAPFEVWGGEQRRDLAFVDDVAEAFLLAAVSPDAQGRAFNIGGDPSLTLLELARILVAASGGGRYEIKEFPPERPQPSISATTRPTTGSSAASPDGGRASRSPTGWRAPCAFFRDHRGDYFCDGRFHPPDRSARFLSRAARGDRRGIARVLAGGSYILGPEVEAFERAFAAYIGCRRAIGVASGTDALTLALRALSLRRRGLRRHGVAHGGGDGRGDRAGRRAAAARRYRPRGHDARPRGARARVCGAAGPHRRDRAGASLRPGSRPRRDPRARPAAWRARGRGLRAVPRRDAGRAGGSALSATSPSSASIRPRISARFGDGGMVVTNDAALAAKRRGTARIWLARALCQRRARAQFPPRSDPGGDPRRQARAARRR